MDVVANVRRLPVVVETVIAEGHFRNPGGKGSNQAVAARRLGSRVAMVGQVGADADGRDLVHSLKEEGVDITHVAVSDTHGTGLAMITVDASGENVIVVSAGASGALTPDPIEGRSNTSKMPKVLLLATGGTDGRGDCSGRSRWRQSDTQSRACGIPAFLLSLIASMSWCLTVSSWQWKPRLKLTT